MWNFLMDYLFEAAVQSAILIVFVWYCLTHRRDPSLELTRIGMPRVIIMLLAFVYFLLVWSTTLRPMLAKVSVFGMFLINLSMLNSLILARLERPYRDALAAYCQDPQQLEALEAIWKRGKRFYYWRHFLAALKSRVSPFHFLHEMAAGRIRDDVQDCLRKRGFTQQFISLKGLLDHLKTRLAREGELPADFRDMVLQDMEKFGSHIWIEEQVNEYLQMAIDAPEKIHNPDWAGKWEATRTASR